MIRYEPDFLCWGSRKKSGHDGSRDDQVRADLLIVEKENLCFLMFFFS